MEKPKILVWDLPTRAFHWLLAGSFVGAFLTAESERYRDVHVMLGYTTLGLIAFRVLWGFVGTRYARFNSFTFSMRKVSEYLRSLLARDPAHYVGHNPAGSWAIYALLVLGVLTGISGYATYEELGGDRLGALHEALGNAMLGIVMLHIAGVVLSGFLHRENLVKAMLTGYKRGDASDGIVGRRSVVAGLLVVTTVVFWAGGFDDWFGTPTATKPAQQATDGDH